MILLGNGLKRRSSGIGIKRNTIWAARNLTPIKRQAILHGKPPARKLFLRVVCLRMKKSNQPTVMVTVHVQNMGAIIPNGTMN